MSLLYPSLEAPQPDRTFRLSVIKEHDDYLARMAETRLLLAKRHHRVANAVDGVSLEIIGGLEVAGVALILTGIGSIPVKSWLACRSARHMAAPETCYEYSETHKNLAVRSR